ncbi:MAG: hypothetical protein KDD42_06010 [Bdellovibrionales bacterium]|nr:hypothetical protein [Bdellovibrionales bacterium]
MSFLAEAYETCEYCGGKRFTEEVQSVRYRGYSVSDVLEMTFDEAKSVFTNHRKIHRALHTACDLGLGYLTLGQSSTTLSGGESQRIKLISELARPQRGHTVYILDEPTIGLHRKDVARLIRLLRNLVALQNTVIVIEHDRDLVEAADRVIEFGPGAGPKGGSVVYQGPPTASWSDRSLAV